MPPKQLFEFEDWDGDRLRVNRAFTSILTRHALTSFAAFQKLSGGEIAKEMAHNRVTRRFVLHDESHEHAFYLKQQHAPALREYIKPLLRLRRPIVGVTHEWNAILRCHQLGIPTMVPVAMGRSQRQSFIFTQALEGFEKLSDWMYQHLDQPQVADLVAAGRIARSVAHLAKIMHAGGMHHQDFYLGHLLWPVDDRDSDLHIIDLGRARWHRHLSSRWVIKDLAQLNYSAKLVRNTDRFRFLQAYFGRRLEVQDKALVRSVLAKSRSIARHSAKHGL